MIRLLRCVSTCLVLLTLGIAWAAAPQPAVLDPWAPACFDTDSPQVKREQGTGLPVHQALAHYVLQSLRNGGTPNLECKGAVFGYRVRITLEGAQVESRYLRTGRLHALALVGAQGVTGTTRLFWPDGGMQAVEYHCSGTPVGFHRYYDQRGQLVAVADHSASDYRTERNMKGGRTYITEEGSTVRGLPEYRTFGSVLIRKLHEVRGGRVQATHLQWKRSGNGYDTLDPASSLEQWLRPGPQGWVRLQHSRVMLINNLLDYRPFAEVYERQRLGIPGADPVEPSELALLACPSTDEAMRAPIADAALARAPVFAMTETERAATPRARYLACLTAPTRTCLLEWGVYQVNSEDSHRETYAIGAAAVAEALREPETMRRAADIRFSRLPDFHQPYPELSLPELLRARAAQLAGDPAEADRLARAAMARAQVPVPAHEQERRMLAWRVLGPLLAEWGFLQEAQFLYARQEEARDPQAWRTLRAIGLAQARAGQPDLAEASAARLATAPTVSPLAARGLDAPGMGWFTPRSSLIAALAHMAQVAAEQGRIDVARSWLARAEAQVAESRNALDTVARLQMGLAYARLGQADQLAALLGPHTSSARSQERLRAIAALCESGNHAAGRMLLAREPALPIAITSHSSIEHAWVGAARAACGEPDAAQALFEIAKQQYQEMRDCWGDLCGGFRAHAASQLAQALIDARRMDLLEAWSTSLSPSASTRLRWAAALAGAGDSAAALRQLGLVVPDEWEPSRSKLRTHELLVRARIARARGSSTTVPFEEAIAAAQALDGSHARMLALVEVAEAARSTGEPELSKAALEGAMVHVDMVLQMPRSAPGRFISDAQQALGRIAAEWVWLGQDAEAERIAEASVMPPGARQLAQQQAIAAREVRAVAAVRAGRFDQALAQIAPMPISPARVHLFDLAWRSGLSGNSTREHGWMASRWGELPATIQSAPSLHEARRVIGVYAGWLRDAGPDEAAPARIEALVKQATALSNTDLRARVLCELGATANALQPIMGPALWEQAHAALRERRGNSFFPVDVPAHGACAYWMRLSGDVDGAVTLIDAAVRPFREAAMKKQGTGGWAYAGDLLALSVLFTEAEAGELSKDWREGWWQP